MADVAIRMRELPTGEGVGRETLVHEAERGLGQRTGQVEVKLLNLRREHQALVDDGAAGERRQVEIALVLNVRVLHLVIAAASDDIELPLKGLLVHALWAF